LKVSQLEQYLNASDISHLRSALTETHMALLWGGRAPGALRSAGRDVDDLAYVCLSLSGVDTAEDEEQIRCVVQGWLPERVRIHCPNPCMHI
jgi:hypothetical protein